jgi:hypothetical protein
MNTICFGLSTENEFPVEFFFLKFEQSQRINADEKTFSRRNRTRCGLGA